MINPTNVAGANINRINIDNTIPETNKIKSKGVNKLKINLPDDLFDREVTLRRIIDYIEENGK